jgi:hypothetical protein
MDIQTWLESEPGRSIWLAEKLNLTKGAISQWKAGGVPLVHIPKVAELTGHAVTEAELLRHAMNAKLARAA